MSFVGITEGAIPFTLVKASRLIPVNVIGAALGAGVCAALGTDAIIPPLGGMYGFITMQYLDDPDCGVEVVVFGHTHIPDYRYFGDNRFYVNSGTWIDINLDAAPDLTRTFALVTTGDIDLASLCRYEKTGTVTDISENNSAATRR